MPIQNYPAVGVLVDITLANDSMFTAYWDGLQWWMGVPDEPNDVPVNNSFVVSWKHQVQV